MLTITKLIEKTAAEFSIFDMGRSVRNISTIDFAKFEDQKSPYPYPMLGHAWFAILIWSKNNLDDHQIWFLKLPLDEQGLLRLDCRDDFVKRTLEDIMGKQKDSAPDNHSGDQDNPWGFSPQPDKMACIHAKCSLIVGLPPSQYYGETQTFMASPDKYKWETLSIQGVADFCARLPNECLQKDQQKAVGTTLSNEAQLVAALPILPEALLLHLLPQLENDSISAALANAISQRINPQQANSKLIAAAIRALSQAPQPITEAFVTQALDSEHRNNIDVLVAISGRAWHILENTELCSMYLEALANNEAGQQAFQHILKDILSIPGCGTQVRQLVNQNQGSDQLKQSIAVFLRKLN